MPPISVDLYHGNVNFDIQQGAKFIDTIGKSILKLVKWPTLRAISFEITKMWFRKFVCMFATSVKKWKIRNVYLVYKRGTITYS